MSKVFLEAREAMQLRLSLEPSAGIKAGTYAFTIQALGDLSRSNVLNVYVRIVRPVVEEVELSTASRTVSGPPGSIFRFTFSVRNNEYRDLVIRLDAEVPEGWYKVGFKPSAYEERVISDLTVKARSTHWGAVLEVWCPDGTRPGAYPLKIVASMDGLKQVLEVAAVVTGVPKLSIKTAEEVLSYALAEGEVKEIALIVKNEGSEDLRDLTIYARAPSGWRTAVEPSKISLLPVGRDVLVSLFLNPPPGSLAGDYSVEASVYGMGASSNVQLRITVTKPTYWGIVGVAVIVVSVLGLFFVFRRFGRA